MNRNQKEGIFIIAVSEALLLIFALFTDWRFGFGLAEVCFDGFKFSCEPYVISPIGDLFGKCSREPFGDAYRHLFAFCIYFRHMLVASIPIVLYGLLRTLGIVKRLFKFEERFFKFID